MDIQYSLHEIGFFYNDQSYVRANMGDSVGFYETLEAAQKAKMNLDIEAFRRIMYIHGENCLTELSSFYEGNFEAIQVRLVDYANSQNWDRYLTKETYGNSSETYWQLVLPENITDEQLSEILLLITASFYEIIAYKDVRKCAYIQMNKEFWDKKVLNQLKSEGVLKERNLYMIEMEMEEYYLINQVTESIEFSNENDAIEAAVDIFLSMIDRFPEYNFLAKTYVKKWSEAEPLLMAFLQNCKSIKLNSQHISEENKCDINAKLKEYLLQLGDDYFEVEFPDFENAEVKEVMGLIELLKVKPFEAFNKIAKINGKEIDYLGGEFGSV